MGTLAELLVKLGIDKTGYDKGLDDAEKKTGTSLKAIGDKLSSVGRTMSLAVTTPIVAGFALAVNAASDMNETMSKANVVFGDSAKAVIDFTSTASTGLGMTQQSALEAAGTLGNLFVALKMGEGPAATMSIGLIKLASDLASFNNLDPTEVLEKLRSGLVGETEPLRSLGVNISEATVKAKALEMGLGDVKGNLTEAEKATVRYALIMEQTTTAQGDFARTSDGLANSTRILKAQVVDMAAKFGAYLLPIATKIVKTFSGWLDKLQQLSPKQQKFIVIVLAVVAAIGPLLIIIGSLVSALGTIGPVLLGLAGPILAIIAVVGLLYLAWTNNWLGIQDKLKEVWNNTLEPALNKLWEWLQVAIPAAIQTVSDYWNNTLVPALTTVWNWIVANVVPAFVTIRNWLQTNIPAAIQTVSDWWNNTFLKALATVRDYVVNEIFPKFETLWNWLQLSIPAAVQTISDFWNNTLLPALGNVWAYLVDNFIPRLAEVYTWLQDNVPVAIQKAADFFNNTLVPAMTTTRNYIVDTLGPAIVTFTTETLPKWQTKNDEIAKQLADLFGPALISIFDIINKYIIPIFDTLTLIKMEAMIITAGVLIGAWDRINEILNTVGTFINDHFGKYLSVLSDFLTNTFNPAVKDSGGLWQTMGDTIDRMVKGVLARALQILKDIAAALLKIIVPKDLIGNSPSPFELSLLGIGDAMDRLSSKKLPAFSMALGMGAGGQTVNNRAYNLTVYSNSETSSVLSDFGRMRAWARA